MPHATQVLFQEKLVRFMLMHAGVVDVCIREWLVGLRQHRADKHAAAGRLEKEDLERSEQEARVLPETAFGEVVDGMIERDHVLVAVEVLSITGGKGKVMVLPMR